MIKYDIIGDIHGHADKLKALLQKLGYTNVGNNYSHPERKALFVGDYIDRGPKIRETLQVVKAMADSGAAIALLGNHEFNAICYNTPTKDGGFVRPHSGKNTKQHIATLNQFAGYENEYQAYLAWFKTLPLFYEDEYLRATHACWDAKQIAVLKENFLPNGYSKVEELWNNTKVRNALEIVLKGKELSLPEGKSFHDEQGHERTETRIKWWINPEGKTYADLCLSPTDGLDKFLFDGADASYYMPTEKPIFFGHYWMNGTPKLQQKNVCCTDYSVAKNGALCAYRFGGEQTLDVNNFVVF